MGTSELKIRIVETLLKSLDTLKPPAGMSPMLLKLLVHATHSKEQTFTRCLIDHFADELAKELIDDIKS